METPKALTIIEKVVETFGDDVYVGAGTVLDPETAQAAIMAGAKFIVSPTVNIKTIKMAKKYGVISIPGAFTPTEILTAYEHGGDIIKVFPASTLGPGYFKNLAGPLSHIPLIPTGGINVQNAKDYILAGAIAIGAGSSLVNLKKPLTTSYLETVETNAKRFIEEIRNAREQQII